MNGKLKAQLVLYKEITAADLLKMAAASASSGTGGGARDLRLPHAVFGPVIARLLPQTRLEPRGRRDDGDALVHHGPVSYTDASGAQQETDLAYWPPTQARPREGRLARVHDSPALGGRAPASDKGRVFFLLIKFSDGKVGAYYAYEDDLRAGRWAADVAQPMLSCLTAAAVSRKSVQGYIDLGPGGVNYCHA